MGQWGGIELDGLVLHSGRLTLRPWQPQDAAEVQAVMADERMHRYLPLPWPYTAEHAHSFVTGHGQAGRAAGTRLDCAIAENATGRLEIYNRVKLWQALTGDDTYDPDYWVTRVSNRPQRVVAQRSLNPHAAKKEGS